MPISGFEYSGPPIGENDIDELEQKLGVTLPPDYRAFLLRTNGGRPVPEDAFGDEDTGSMMNMFYAVKHERISFTIAQEKRAFRSRIPEDLLPIGDDAGGSQICIGIGPDNYGKVYFWRMYDEEDLDEGEKPDYRNVHLVSETFSEFLDTFREYEDDEDDED